MNRDDLRAVFVVDAIQGRNGVGTYFQDLTEHLRERAARIELVAPSLEQPHPCQGRSLPMPGDPTQRLFLPRMRVLTQTVLNVQPHVMVLPGPGIFSLAGFWLARRLGIPVCVTFQTDYDHLVRLYWGPTLARFAGGILHWLNGTLFRGASSVVTISHSMAAQARYVGVVEPRLVGTPLAPVFVNTPVTAMPDRLRTVLYVGRLAAEKNIGAFLQMARQRPDLRFRIVGDGPQRALVQRQAQVLPNLEFLGWRPRLEVVRQLDESQVLVLPSSVEAFGTVALEAMARRRLVITTPACGINQWPRLATGLITVRPDETLTGTLNRVEAMPVAERTLLAARARDAALAVHRRGVQDWLEVLGDTARRAATLPRPAPSPTLALLRRLGADTVA